MKNHSREYLKTHIIILYTWEFLSFISLFVHSFPFCNYFFLNFCVSLLSPLCFFVRFSLICLSPSVFIFLFLYFSVSSLKSLSVSIPPFSQFYLFFVRFFFIYVFLLSFAVKDSRKRRTSDLRNSFIF
jgi:hypothetical protein